MIRRIPEQCRGLPRRLDAVRRNHSHYISTLSLSSSFLVRLCHNRSYEEIQLTHSSSLSLRLHGASKRSSMLGNRKSSKVRCITEFWRKTIGFGYKQKKKRDGTLWPRFNTRLSFGLNKNYISYQRKAHRRDNHTLLSYIVYRIIR